MRQHDPDRYLCALFARHEFREALFALSAFNVELSMVAGRVSEPALGLIRLQWWRDSIDMLQRGDVRSHAVVRALDGCPLDPALMHRLIDARERDLEPTPFADLSALEGYLAETAVLLSDLALDVLEVRDAGTRASAEGIARCWGLTGLLRAAPHMARAGRMMLPDAVMQRHGARPGDYRELRDTAALRAVAREMGRLAGCALDGAGRPARFAAAAPVLLPATLARVYLARLEAAGWNMFDPAVNAPVPFGIWRLLIARWLHRT